MFIAVFARRLRPGRTYEDFIEAWYPDKGFGVPARVTTATNVRLDDVIESTTLRAFYEVGDEFGSVGQLWVAVGTKPARARCILASTRHHMGV